MGRYSKEAADHTRERLLDAAGRLFAVYGVGAVSVNDICDLASVSRGAVYWHFSDKSTLLEALFRRSMPLLQRKTDAFLRDFPVPGSDDVMRAFCASAVSDLMSDTSLRCVVRVLLSPCGSADAELVQRSAVLWLDDIHRGVCERLANNACVSGSPFVPDGRDVVALLLGFMQLSWLGGEK